MNVNKIIENYIKDVIFEDEDKELIIKDKINKVLSKLKDPLTDSDEYKVSMSIKSRDAIYNVLKILLAFEYCSNIGHSADGIFDDTIKFFIDGDGGDRIFNIKIEKRD